MHQNIFKTWECFTFLDLIFFVVCCCCWLCFFIAFVHAHIYDSKNYCRWDTTYIAATTRKEFGSHYQTRAKTKQLNKKNLKFHSQQQYLSDRRWWRLHSPVLEDTNNIKFCREKWNSSKKQKKILFFVWHSYLYFDETIHRQIYEYKNRECWKWTNWRKKRIEKNIVAKKNTTTVVECAVLFTEKYTICIVYIKWKDGLFVVYQEKYNKYVHTTSKLVKNDDSNNNKIQTRKKTQKT